MTQKKILELFIQAEKDWSRPYDDDNPRRTQFGLCYYYFEQLDATDLDLLRSYWGKYSTVKPKGIDYDFRYLGSNTRGRNERLEAIRKVIKELEDDLLKEFDLEWLQSISYHDIDKMFGTSLATKYLGTNTSPLDPEMNMELEELETKWVNMKNTEKIDKLKILELW